MSSIIDAKNAFDKASLLAGELLESPHKMYLPARTTSPFSLEPVSLEDNGQRILAITGFFTTFACTAVVLRMYVRITILKSTGMDDYAMICAAVSLTLTAGCSTTK